MPVDTSIFVRTHSYAYERPRINVRMKKCLKRVFYTACCRHWWSLLVSDIFLWMVCFVVVCGCLFFQCRLSDLGCRLSFIIIVRSLLLVADGCVSVVCLVCWCVGNIAVVRCCWFLDFLCRLSGFGCLVSVVNENLIVVAKFSLRVYLMEFLEFLTNTYPFVILSLKRRSRFAACFADSDPRSGAFLTPGSGIRNRFFADSGSQTKFLRD